MHDQAQLKIVGQGGALRLEHSYNFIDKKPVIDELRTLIGDDDVNELADKSRVARTTIHNWLNGKTVSPRIVTVQAVLYQLGKRLGVVDIER